MEQIILSGLTVEQFGQIIGDKVKEVLEQKEQAKKQVPPSIKEEKFISRKETAKLLHISLPTLNEWTKEGTLKSYRIGTRVLYKPDEVIETVTQRNFTNCERKNK
ncbi:MAG: helix-turn-helix domain-containing protein [Bacteroidia bacterium]